MAVKDHAPRKHQRSRKASQRPREETAANFWQPSPFVRWCQAISESRMVIGFFSIIYLVGVIASILYIQRSWLYRGVESWPTVPAFNVTGTNAAIPSPSPVGTRYGFGGRQLVGTGWSAYDYTVGGTTFHGTRGFPDGNGLPPRGFLPSGTPVPWTAYYKPSDPSVAVLRPLPYEGGMELAFAGIALVLFSLHAIFWIWGKRREQRERLAGPPVDS